MNDESLLCDFLLISTFLGSVLPSGPAVTSNYANNQQHPGFYPSNPGINNIDDIGLIY